MQSKLVFCGLQNGRFELFDLRDKASVYRSPAPSPFSGSLTSIRYNDAHHLLATGSSGGVVAVYDTRVLRSGDGAPVTTFKRNEAAIEDLDFVVRDTRGSPEIGLGIATADGLPYVADVVPEGPAVGAELVDGECDPVSCVRVRKISSPGGDGRLEVWSAADDAIVRRYFI